MSVMSELHADICAVVADAETGANGYLWIWVPDQLADEPGAEIRILCRGTIMGNRAIVLGDFYLTDAGRLHPVHRTAVGAITRDGDSVRIRSTMGRDDEVCLVSETMEMFR